MKTTLARRRAMAGLCGFVDDRRALLRVEGSDARDWLQSLVTNDLRRLGAGRPVYAALLTPQGKYLFDFLLVDAADGAVLLDAPAARMGALTQRLGLYKLRRQVRLIPEGDTGVALVWGAEPAPPPGAMVVPDPRSAALGWRLYSTDPAACLRAMGAAAATRADYDARRVEAAVPESGVELIPDDSYILEAGFERLNGVDFRKGCYVGQEVTARMRHKTELRKGLVRVTVEGAPPPPGAEVLAADGKPAGQLFTVAGGVGLAHLRFDRAGPGMQAGAARLRLLDASPAG
jgi:folate-binding protein YgfZ